MKKIIICLLAILGIATAQAAVPASVTRAVSQIDAAPGLEVTCSINGRAASLNLGGECFILDLGNAKVYYDGKTQWSYLPAEGEVTIIEPTADEVADSNPLQILRHLASDYSGAAVRGEPNAVRLTPTNRRSEIAEATVTFDPQTGWPVKMTLITGSGRADITDIRFQVSKSRRPVADFRFSPPKGATVTDLR